MIDEISAVLSRLAGSADEQLAYLEHLGTPGSADELALELADLVLLLPELVQQRRLSPRQAERIDALDQKLATMSGQPDLWAPSALREAAAWVEVRRLAAEAVRRGLTADQPAPTTR